MSCVSRGIYTRQCCCPVCTNFVIVTLTTLSEFAATLHAIRSCFTVFFCCVMSDARSQFGHVVGSPERPRSRDPARGPPRQTGSAVRPIPRQVPAAAGGGITWPIPRSAGRDVWPARADSGHAHSGHAPWPHDPAVEQNSEWVLFFTAVAKTSWAVSKITLYVMLQMY